MAWQDGHRPRGRPELVLPAFLLAQVETAGLPLQARDQFCGLAGGDLLTQRGQQPRCVA